MPVARGEFDVTLQPLPPYNDDPDGRLGRRSIDKQFRGGLQATSKGEMLSAMTAVSGSAGYVAVERVSGTLDGHSGSFTLQHAATMTRGAPALHIVVVPDSADGELSGLSGTMTIAVTEGKHFYTFEYEIARGD